jgi:hypothetical protein
MFTPGRDLAAALYDEVVAPLVADVPHAAGLLGWGSDVLGYDTARSTDHGWGPRLQVFVAADEVSGVRERVDAGLPETFRGWPTRYGWDDVPARYWVDTTTLPDWLEAQLGFVPQPSIPLVDWLVTPQQRILEVTGGAVFHDDLGDLTAARSLLSWYPDQVWLWLLACQWLRISQEEAFVGRTAELGDDLGSRLVIARVARDLVRLCFLVERRYAPYTKWLGTAFATLDAAADVAPALDRALAGTTHDEREQGLADAYEAVARRHNELGITSPVDPATRPYHGRPYRVLHAERFVAACRERLTDPEILQLPLIGAVDQFVDSTDALGDPSRREAARRMYGWSRERPGLPTSPPSG